MILKPGTIIRLSRTFADSKYHDDVQKFAGKPCMITMRQGNTYKLKELEDYGCEWVDDDFEEIISTPNVKDVYIKRLREKAIKPRYAHGFEDSGMDVFAAAIAYKGNGERMIDATFDFLKSYILQPGETVIIKTGFAFAIPVGTELQARPTSGNSLKTKMRVANSPGTIDAGYRNEVGIIIENTGTTPIHIKENDKVAQLVLCPIYHANLIDTDNLDDTNRGKDGYGSTGTITI